MDREQAKTADGRLRFQSRYNKNSGRFSVVPLKEPKRYEYLPELLKSVFLQRVTTPGSIDQHVSMAEDDPRRIHPRISMLPKPSRQELIQEQKSRFQPGT